MALSFGMRAACSLDSSLARSLSQYAASTSLTSWGACSHRPHCAGQGGANTPLQTQPESLDAPQNTSCQNLESPDCQSKKMPLFSNEKSSFYIKLKDIGCVQMYGNQIQSIARSSPPLGMLGPLYPPFQNRSFASHANLVRTMAVAPDVMGWRPTLEELEREEKKRRAQRSGPSHRALLVDAAGTLLEPSEPAAQVYKNLGKKYGVTISEEDILRRYRWAYSQPWSESHLRYVDDARLFWASVVEASTGCSDPQYFEDLYQYYASAKAWKLTDPHAGEAFAALREAGVKLAVVSNFDTRLRPILEQLGCGGWFDALAVSAEVQAEKPNPTIFLRACELLGVAPEEAVHVGDDRRNDLWGARDAGCDAWLWGDDVITFAEVAEKMGVPVAGETEEPLVA